jgi:allantoinase
VVVSGGRIESVVPASGQAPGSGEELDDLGELILLPGLVDVHVHVNDPGRTEWEGFATASKAARAGGVTTIVDMPLNSIPATTTVAALEAKRRAAAAADIGVEFWGGVVPGNATELEGLAKSGVRGFKCFLSPSGVDEFPNVSESDLREAMPIVARLGLPLLVHAESPQVLDAIAGRVAASDPRQYVTWLASRPPDAEIAAIRLMIKLCEATGCRVHIVHLSAADALPMLHEARQRGLPITVETCPHYLVFAAEDIRDGATAFKCAPPIRGRENREWLWRGLLEDDIDLIGTDHSPCPPELKRHDSGDFMAAWGGIASLELGLAAVWTSGRHRGVTPSHLARWMSERPAALAGLDRKGRIAPGHDADLVAWAPDVEWRVEPSSLRQRHPLTPYDGRRMAGQVRRVWIAGREE